MPIMVIIRGSSVTPQQYEAVRDRVGWMKTPPAGAISHSIAFTEAGATEVNVWESRELFDDYVETRLRPVLAELGVVLDDIQVLETHAVAVGQAGLEHLLPPPEPAEVPDGPVLAICRRRNISADLFDRYRARAPVDTVPQGALAHGYGRTRDGILTVDLWEDSGAMLDYFRNVARPATEAEGVDFEWPEIVPLHAFLTTPAARAHERPFARALAPAE